MSDNQKLDGCIVILKAWKLFGICYYVNDILWRWRGLSLSEVWIMCLRSAPLKDECTTPSKQSLQFITNYCTLFAFFCCFFHIQRNSGDTILHYSSLRRLVLLTTLILQRIGPSFENWIQRKRRHRCCTDARHFSRFKNLQYNLCFLQPFLLAKRIVSAIIGEVVADCHGSLNHTLIRCHWCSMLNTTGTARYS